MGSKSRSCSLCVLSASLLFFAAGLRAEDRVDFSRQIQPILSDKCYKCHGPDKAQRKTDLRLDLEKSAFAEHDGKRVLVPGSVRDSQLFQRIASKDADVQMPPPDSGLTLSATERKLIERWIRQGAKWSKHWSFIKPVKAPLPSVANTGWCGNAIDYFVLQKMAGAGLQPNRSAGREQLIRRVTLDLTGLPPTPAEVDRFLGDHSPGAYERLVDRLLASPRFGERMAARWLDAARYADTSGYQNDGPRYMWRWRDWVIEALNRNIPFSQFTIEQLAGDLLPRPTLEQRIATGFNRNHRGNAEGGIIPEEYAVEYVVDRVDTTATIWLGLTMGCARCHDHKYDPVTQKEFYQFFAYFNNVPESGRAIKEGNSPPFIKAPTRRQRRTLGRLEKQLAKANTAWKQQSNRVKVAQSTWEKSARFPSPVAWSITGGLVAHYPLDGHARSLIAAPDKPSAAPKPVAQPKTKLTNAFGGSFAPGRIAQAASLGEHHVLGGDVANFGYFDKFSISAWVNPAKSTGTLVSRMTPIHRGAGYYVHLEDGKLQVNLVKRWLDDSIRVSSVPKLPINRWTHVTVTYDGSRVAAGISIYLNGKRVPQVVHLDGLNQTFASDEPLRIGGGSAPFFGRIDDVRIYNRPLEQREVDIVSVVETIDQLAALPAGQRTRRQTIKLNEYFLRQAAGPDIRRSYQRLGELVGRRKKMLESFPTVMVMQEMSPPRTSHVLHRGQYNQPREAVAPGVPGTLDTFGKQPANRLEFARWVTSRESPLTARVTVNRLWQMLFGSGLVRSTEDFGVQGERPTHPQLLDWLAVEFMDNGWDVKAILKMMVMSSTYRQSSTGSQQGWSRDPDNRWLARGPRVRLPAEMIRDQALAAAGLLTERLGGPSVKPYQPAGLWQEIATDTNYVQSHGADLYRRGLYTYWKRTVVPPTMSTFDASSRETCVVRQSRTNTPLQALTMLNEVAFVEAARGIAERAMRRYASAGDRIEYAFRLVLVRRPSGREKQILVAGLDRHLRHFRKHRNLARKLVSLGELPVDSSLDVAELAAYATIASMILNVDEAITKE